MHKHRQTGITGEQIAAQFLEAKGLKILFRNKRFGHKEVDLIADAAGIAVMVEVKTRSGYDFGFPEESVTPAKQRHLREAAAAFLEAFPTYIEVRYDVVSIILKGGAVMELNHLPDSFF